MYMVEKKRETFEMSGAWNQKKDFKRLGAEWGQLPEGGEAKAGYAGRFETAVAAAKQHHRDWRVALLAWRETKAARQAGPEGRTSSFVCACRFCTDGDDGDAGEEDEEGKEEGEEIPGAAVE